MNESDSARILGSLVQGEQKGRDCLFSEPDNQGSVKQTDEQTIITTPRAIITTPVASVYINFPG